MTQRKTNVPIQEILERLKTETVVKSVHVTNMLNGTGLTLESTMIQQLPNSHPRMVWNVRHHDAPQLDAPFQDPST